MQNTGEFEVMIKSTEFKVTPEMLREGSRILAEHYMGEGVYDLRGKILTEIYLAMRGKENDRVVRLRQRHPMLESPEWIKWREDTLACLESRQVNQ